MKTNMKAKTPSAKTITQLCAGEVITPGDIAAVRLAGQEIITSLNSACAVEDLAPELRDTFNNVKTSINTMLAGLPETDKVPAAMESGSILRQLMYVLQSAQQMIAQAADVAKRAKGDVKTALATLTTEVDKAVNAKIAAGEVVTKADYDKGVAEATKAGREVALTETKRLNDRRTALASANLPVPAETKLSAEDKEFVAAETEAKRRHAIIAPFKLPTDRVTTLCWDIDAATFDMIAKTIGDAHKGNRLNPMLPKTEENKDPALAPVTSIKRFGAI